jgi:uncharacterized protein YjbJ (UPF0337 family)
MSADRFQDKAEEMKGRAKQAAGDLTDDERLKREGKRDEMAGKTKGKIDELAEKGKDVIERAGDKVRDAVDRR